MVKKSGAPVGQILVVNGKEYHIKPTVLSQETIEALIRVYKKTIQDDLIELYRVRKQLDLELFEDTKDKLMGSMICPGIPQAVAAFQHPRGMAIVLHLCCDEVGTLEEAKKIIASSPNLTDMLKVIAETAAEDVQAAGNSLPQDPTKTLEAKLSA